MARALGRNPSPLLIVIILIAAASGTRAAQPDYDSAQPSSDFGTPETMAKISSNAGFLDVVGSELGMQARGAQAGVMAHNGDLKMGPPAKGEFEALPGVVMTPVFLSPKPGGSCHYVAWGQFGHSVAGSDTLACLMHSWIDGQIPQARLIQTWHPACSMHNHVSRLSNGPHIDAVLLLFDTTGSS